MSERPDGGRSRFRRRAAVFGGAVAVLAAVGLLVAFLVRPTPVEVVAAETGTVRETVEGLCPDVVPLSAGRRRPDPGDGSLHPTHR